MMNMYYLYSNFLNEKCSKKLSLFFSSFLFMHEIRKISTNTPTLQKVNSEELKG